MMTSMFRFVFVYWCFVFLVSTSAQYVQGMPTSNGTATTTTKTTSDTAAERTSPTMSSTPDSISSTTTLTNEIFYKFNKTQIVIEGIKEQILRKLGMRTAPDVSRVNTSVQEKRRVLRLYRKSIEEMHGKTYSLLDDEHIYASQFHSYTDDGQSQKDFENGLRVHFAIDIQEPNDAQKETIAKTATLKLYKSKVKPQNLKGSDAIDNSVRLDVYQIMEPPRAGRGQTERRFITSKTISLDSPGWEEFTVTKAVQEWIRDPTTNFGFEVVCDSKYKLFSVVEFVTVTPNAVNENSVNEGLAPTMNVFTHEKMIMGRYKRSTSQNDCPLDGAEHRCCRNPIKVDFSQLNWDWVVAPQMYDMYYCNGSCPYRFKTAHNFASLQAYLNSISMGVVPALKCFASKLSSLTMAHYNNEGTLVVSVFENMMVEECMCA